MIQTDNYLEDGDGVFEPWDGQTPGEDKLIGRSQAAYDERGRVYQTIGYGVDPNTGTVKTAANELIVSDTWYDAAGNVLKSSSSTTAAFTKTQYDSLHRPTVQYVGYDTDETTYESVASAAYCS